MLWSYRTTTRNSIGKNPFELAIGSKVVVLVEVGFPTAQTESFDAPSNDKELCLNLDLLEGRRETL